MGVIKILKNKKGAVSVQAVFMMLILVSLGSFSIVSARVNYVFSVKALDWNRMYYALESMAEEYVMETDRVLISVKERALAGNGGSGYIDEIYDGLEGLGMIYFDNFIYFDGGDLYTEMNFTSNDNENMNLRVVLKINGDIQASERYFVHEWAQWQKAPDDAGGMGLWDGIF